MDDGLEFLDLKLKMVNGKISVDVFSKPTNSFTYVLPSICYHDEKYVVRSEEYQRVPKLEDLK